MRDFEEALKDFLKDRDFLKVIDQFHTFHWRKKSNEEKKAIIYELEKNTARILKDELIDIYFASGKNYGGLANYSANTIQFSEDSLRVDNQYDILNTYFHERRHFFQNSIIQSGKHHNQADSWRANRARSHALRLSNYVLSEGGVDYELYRVQPLEFDANKWGSKMAETLGKIILTRVGQDDKFKEYITTNFFMNIQATKFTSITQLKKGLKDMWDENDRKFAVAMNKSYKKDEDLENLSAISDEKLYEFFNEFILEGLKMSEIVAILKELDRRERKKEGLTDNQTIFNIVDGYIVKMDNLHKKTETDVYASLTLLYPYYELLAEEKKVKLLNSNEQSNPKVEKLKVNEYVDRKNKKINYVKHEKDAFFYKVQPTYVYVSEFVLKKLKKIYPYAVKDLTDSNKKYEAFDRAWQGYFYRSDQKRFRKLVEEMYGTSYEEVENKLIELMKKNIDKSKAAEELEDRLKKSYQKKLQ